MMPVNRQSRHNRPYPGAAYRWPDGRDTARSGKLSGGGHDPGHDSHATGLDPRPRPRGC